MRTYIFGVLPGSPTPKLSIRSFSSSVSEVSTLLPDGAPKLFFVCMKSHETYYVHIISLLVSFCFHALFIFFLSPSLTIFNFIFASLFYLFVNK